MRTTVIETPVHLIVRYKRASKEAQVEANGDESASGVAERDALLDGSAALARLGVQLPQCERRSSQKRCTQDE